MNLQFHPAAAEELEVAIRDGLKFGRGIGLRLRLEVARVTLLLCDSPNIGTPITRTSRKFPLSGFPFVLVYRVAARSRYARAAKDFGPNVWNRGLVP
jgi:hypothetical protein